MNHYEIKLIMKIPFPYVRTSLYHPLTNETFNIILANALVYSPDEKTELPEEEIYGPTPFFFFLIVMALTCSNHPYQDWKAIMLKMAE